VIEWLTRAGAPGGKLSPPTRDSLVAASLAEAVDDLTKRYGSDVQAWAWGNYHHAIINHPLAAAVDAATRAKLDAGPAPRGGDAYTVGATGNGENQTSGASFRIVTDVSDWEKTAGINTPGQSGNPDDPHYKDLFPLWATDRYVSVPYRRDRVEAAAESHLVLSPR
jgi:penicillin amidase